MAWWPWSRTVRFDPTEQRSASWSVSDPAIVELLGLGSPNLAGVAVGESSVLGLAAVYRAVSLIAGTIASLPMRTIETNKDGHTERARSFLDTPGGPTGPTPFEWKEQVLVHLLLHGNAYCAHIYGGAGQIVGLLPVHPLAVTVEMQPDGSRLFTVSLADGTRRVFNSAQLTHIPALSTDGVAGLSPIAVARNVFGTSLAGDRAAARMFSNGAMISGLVTPEEDLTEDEAKTIKDSLRQKIQGGNNSGDIAVINRKLRFEKWSMSAEDAQFLQSRAFQVEEIARFYGVPPHLLMQTEKQTSWGTGVQEQNRGLARYTLEPWTTRIQERLSRLLTGGRKCEFDYSAFVQPDPETEISLLIQQVEAGLLTINEARKIRNLPPLPGGDVITDDADAGTDENDSGAIDSGLAVMQRFGQPLILPAPVTNGAHHG
jgi:HK97 family phage portal protein